MFPCPSCGNAAGQVNSLVDYIVNNALKVGMIWLDIEGTQYWTLGTTGNQNFFQGLVSQLKTRGMSFGVYTSSSQWSPIMGSSYTGGSAYQLWWAYWDDNWSNCCGVFKPFAGWSTCAMKQYSGDQSFCGGGFDKNCY
eukprot:TRINITY_DN41_c0_g1_i19.p1 TRINITY_DN41_c0_g1~~TRINITY_DN41_c0_g1_i19.p1  ORF type:complete len:138 (+),score=32.07 TRINITY_DN41_c0_g1_i19:139-552(+)